MASAYIGALGIGVGDLERSADFYTRVIGMKKLQTLNLPHMNEEELGFDGCGPLVLKVSIECKFKC